MGIDTYTVILSGFESDTTEPATLVPRLAAAFGIEEARARWTLSQLPFEVTSGAEAELAERYHHALRSLGGIVELRADAPLPVETHIAGPLEGAADLYDASQAVDVAQHGALELVGNDHDGDANSQGLVLGPLAVSDPSQLSGSDVQTATTAGIAPHALGPRALSARAPADVRRNASSRPPGGPTPVLRRDHPRWKRTGMPVGLGRTMWLITVAGAWTAIWYYLSDETVTVESDSGAHEFKYVHILSESAKDGVELPLVIALHGNGDTPNGFYESLLEGFEEPARFVLFRAPKDFSGGRLRGTAWPHSAQAIKRYGERLVRAIELVSEKYPSRCKPILLGFSGGAHMAYYQAANHPQKFRLIVPVAGKLFPDLVPIGSPRSTKGLPPVHIFHGERDDLVSIRAGQGAAEVLRKRNMDVSLAMLTGGHDAIFRGGRYPLLELLQQTALACQ